MSVYSLLKNNSKPTRKEIEHSLDGNICRCTGYRAILDAMKSFSGEDEPIDIEDLKSMKCLSNSNCDAGDKHECTRSDETFYAEHGQNEWYSIRNLSELSELLKKINNNSSVRMVSGNTSIGIFKHDGPFQTYINIKNITELNVITKCDISLKIGASITLTRFIETFRTFAKQESSLFGHLNELALNLERVGSKHIRNVATWSGNLVVKKDHQDFPSDVLVILEAAGISLNVYNLDSLSSTKTNFANLVKMSLEDFLKTDDLKTGHFLIESLELPSFNQQMTRVKVFKIAPRSQNSHAYVNAGKIYV